MDLIEISQNEVIAKARAWATMVKRQYVGVNMHPESSDLFAAVTLLESREAVRAELDSVNEEKNLGSQDSVS